MQFFRTHGIFGMLTGSKQGMFRTQALFWLMMWAMVIMLVIAPLFLCGGCASGSGRAGGDVQVIWFEDTDGVTMSVYGTASGDCQTYEVRPDNLLRPVDECAGLEVCRE